MAARDVHTGPGAGMEPGGVRFLFRSFKRILALNTRVLERMAQMDRALGGDYVFDKAFLESSVRDVCRLTHQVAYHLNGMDGEGCIALYDASLAVQDALEDILSGGMGSLAGRRVLPFSEITWELEPLVGLCSVGLAVLGRRMGLPAADGFAVTTVGMGGLAGPEPLEAQAEVTRAAQELFARLGGAQRLELSFISAGPQGTGRILSALEADTAEEVAKHAASFAREHSGLLAVCVRPVQAGLVQGTLQTLAHDPSLPPAMLAVAGPIGREDRAWLSRVTPHIPLRTRTAVKPLDASLPGGKATDLSRGSMLRGSSWLLPDKAALLAELGLAAERALDGPCLLSWVLNEKGFVLSGLEPAEAAFPEWPEEQSADGVAFPGEEDVLLRGGQAACSGVGAGAVVLLDDDTLPESVPLGSIGAARAASPALSRIVPRLGALLAEVGTAASHLATVARENRVPAVFGLKGVRKLAPGGMVTVDAEQGVVYRGVAEGLLRQAAMERAQLGAAPEFVTLRRLLRHIRPLNMVDPAAEGFCAENCRTCHDIIHFAHERAVELLLSMDTSKDGGLGAARRLREDSPFDLRVVDLGGGLAGQGGEVGLKEISSLPLRAFLDGLLLRDVQRRGPARLGLGDILSGLGRSGQALSSAPGNAGLNLALAARDYANITLRLGYHFSVIDAVVSDRPEQTFVYFRFAGGFASEDRRARRAGLILRVLERLGFRASRKGDLVVGKRKLLEAQEALETLRQLGALSAYTRQLDVELADDAEVERFAREFLAAVGLPGLPEPEQEDA